MLGIWKPRWSDSTEQKRWESDTEKKKYLLTTEFSWKRALAPTINLTLSSPPLNCVTPMCLLGYESASPPNDCYSVLVLILSVGKHAKAISGISSNTLCIWLWRLAQKSSLFFEWEYSWKEKKFTSKDRENCLAPYHIQLRTVLKETWESIWERSGSLSGSINVLQHRGLPLNAKMCKMITNMNLKCKVVT